MNHRAGQHSRAVKRAAKKMELMGSKEAMRRKRKVRKKRARKTTKMKTKRVMKARKMTFKSGFL